MKNLDRKVIYIGLGFLVAGLFLGWLFFGGTNEAGIADVEVGAEDGAVHEEAVEVWTCAMHPQIRQDGPGQCPICGMDLIPVASGGESVGADEVQLTAAAMQLANIETVEVEAAVPTKEIYLPGKVQADERNVKAITARFPGRIETLYVNFTGEEVSRGERLASIYSPELIQAQKELLEAAKFRESNPSFFNAARKKLELWNLSEAQIENILETGEVKYNFDIYATQSGTVVGKEVNEGDYVTEGQPLFRVAGLTDVWVVFDAYESDLAWIDEGDEIKFTTQSIPGKIFEGEVTFIDPLINPQTRIAAVRTEVENPGGKLKPNMFVQGILESRLDVEENTLVVPKSAVLWTGKRAVVYVKNPLFEQPTFAYREVILGPEAGDLYVVMEGLEAGEEVAANGVFKIDAAAQLEGKRSMMNPTASEPPMPPMPGMDMSGGEVQVETAAYVEADVVDFSSEVPADFSRDMSRLVNIYLEMKEAYVATEEENIRKALEKFVSLLNEMEGANLLPEARDFWLEKGEFLLRHARINLEAENLKEKRENFVYISHVMIKVVEAFGAEKQLFVDYCPMAEAFWLSEVEPIRNPYMPEMLRCGEVVQTISKQ